MKSRSKFTGAEVKAWYRSDWGPDVHIDDDSWEVNGQVFDANFDPETLSDADEVKIVSGVIFDPHSETYFDAVKELRKWLKAQTVDLITVEVPKDKREAFEALLADHLPGVKIRA